MADIEPMVQHAPQMPERKRRFDWLILAAMMGMALGLSLPFALDRALDVYFLVLAGLMVAGILLMPRKLAYDDTACWVLFIVFIVLYSLYPHYISLRISGLPWISPIRLILAVLFFIWIYALRTSPSMQDNIVRYIRENPLFFKFFGLFLLSQLLGMPTARDLSQTFTKFSLFQLYWTFPLFATLSLVRTQRRFALVPWLFIACAAVQCAVGFVEARQQRLLWLDYLPPGFGADSEMLQRVLQGQFRADGYRVQGSWSVSLVYAEFLVMMLPFALHAAIEGRSKILRLTGLITALAILPAQFLSGSRLGMVGTIVVFLVLMTIYIIRIWKTDKRGMYGPLALMMLPLALTLFAAAFVASPRLQTMTIGGGQHQSSNDGRYEQARMAMPRVIERPLFGHGIGQGAEALGYRNLAGTLTIDSYFLNIILEVGIVGFIAYFGMILTVIWSGAKAYLDPRAGPNERMGGPLALSLIAYLVVKLVLSQTDTHMLLFLMMGLVLVARRGTALEPSPQAAPDPGVRPRRGRLPPIYGAPGLAKTRAVPQRILTSGSAAHERATDSRARHRPSGQDPAQPKHQKPRLPSVRSRAFPANTGSPPKL